MSTNEKVFQDVFRELVRAQAEHAPMVSAHEGYAVVKEEVDELWDAVKSDDRKQALHEAIHVAAMAIRFVRDLSKK